MTTPSFKVELFVADLDASIDFYRRVAGFTVAERQPDGYTAMRRGAVVIALNLRAALSPDHPIYIPEHQRPGLGVELVLSVEDIRAEYARVKQQGWPISAEIRRQPWGADDFRLVDPDGYYLRFTS